MDILQDTIRCITTGSRSSGFKGSGGLGPSALACKQTIPKPRNPERKTLDPKPYILHLKP